MASENIQVDNPYGLQALWLQGDFIAKGVLILLVLMSAYSWFIIFTKWWEQRRLLSQAKEVEKSFWTAENLRAGLGKLSGKGNIFRSIASEAIDASEHHGVSERMAEGVPLHEWIDNVIARAVNRIGNALNTQLPFLATTGSTAPFIGLFGTVWGIYHALVAIGVAGQASIDKVAGPVGEALIMTAIGLAVAVPAVLGYNYLLGRNKQIIERVKLFASDLEQVIVSGSRVSPSQAAKVIGAATAGKK
jgi:biopolymer transport protein ExbB